MMKTKTIKASLLSIIGLAVPILMNACITDFSVSNSTDKRIKKDIPVDPPPVEKVGKCSDEQPTIYKKSLLTKIEIAQAIEDTFGLKAVRNQDLADLIDSLPEQDSDFKNDNTIFSSNNNGRIKDEFYSRLLMEIGLKIGEIFTANSSFTTICPSITECHSYFKETIALKLWRRPASQNEFDITNTGFTDDKNGREKLFSALVISALASPQFYYKGILEKSSSSSNQLQYQNYALASRLSFFLYGSIPDKTLFDLAKNNTINQPEVLSAQIDRLVRIPKYKSRLIKNIMMKVFSLNKDQDSDAKMTNLAGASVEKKDFSLQIYKQIEHILDNNLNIKSIIKGDKLFTNRSIATYQKLPNATDLPEAMSVVNSDSSKNIYSSLLTNPLYLTHFQNGDYKTLVSKRGMHIYNMLLCKDTPTVEADPSVITQVLGSGDLSQIMIGRIRTSHNACSSCHNEPDRIGIPMEFINDFGQFRTTYKDSTPIDSFKINLIPNKDNSSISSFDEFLTKLSNDQRFQQCVVTKLKSKFKNVDIIERQPCSEDLASRNKENGLVDLLKSIVTEDMFTQVKATNNE